jgi:hypothetical protein
VNVQLDESVLFDVSELLHRMTRYSGSAMFVQFSTEIDADIRSSWTCILIFVDVLRGNGLSVIVKLSLIIIWLFSFPPRTNVQLRPALFSILLHVTLTVLFPGEVSESDKEQLFDVLLYIDNLDASILEQL